MKPLSGEDAFFIYAETEDQHQHTVACLILDPATAPGSFSTKDLVKKMEADIGVIPEFRQKLVSMPAAFAPPVLVDDPDFKFKNHVRQTKLKAPGDMRQLCELIEGIASKQLDRKRPLWESWYVDGLEGARIACITKSHHCMLDGVQGAEFMSEQFDLEPNPPKKKKKKAAGPWEPEKISLFNVTSKAWSHHRKTQPGLGYMLTRTAKSLYNRRRVFKEHAKAEKWVPPMMTSAPKLKFNGAITPNRSVAMGKLSMRDIKHIKNTFGVSINDVVLTSCTLAMRKYLIATNDLPEEPLICAVPVSLKLKGAEAKQDQGNQVGNMMVKLPVQIGDPVKCLRATNESTIEAKRIFDESFENLMQGYIGSVAPGLASFALQTIFSKRMTNMMPAMGNLVVSNFPGPPIPLFMQGAQLQASYPIGPVISGQGPNITFMSFMDSMDFSVQTCTEMLPEVWDIADAIVAVVAELKAKADKQAKPKARRAKSVASKKAVTKKVAKRKANKQTKKTTAKKKAATASKKKVPAKAKARKAPRKKTAARSSRSV